MLFQSIAAYQLLLTLQKDTPLQFPYPTTNNAHKSVAAPKNSNLASLNVFCLLSTQQIQTLLTLFSKFFSFFPQGTCLLTVSSFYLSLHETYHPFCTPFPKSVILQMHTVNGEQLMANRNITLVAAPFQEAYTRAIGHAFQHYNSRL